MSVQSHILTNKSSLSLVLVVSPSGNTTSLYLDTFIYAFDCSSDPLINCFAQLFRNCSCCLQQLFRYY